MNFWVKTLVKKTGKVLHENFIRNNERWKVEELTPGMMFVKCDPL